MAKKPAKTAGGKSAAEKPKPAAPKAASPAPRTTATQMFGEMVWLLSCSRRHRGTTLADVDRLVGPPLKLGQFRVFREKSRPVGLALWAFVDAATDQRLSKGGVEIKPDEWKKGDILWLVELVAPFATRANAMDKRMVANLVQTVFKGKSFRLMLTDAKTGKRQAAWFRSKGTKG